MPKWLVQAVKEIRASEEDSVWHFRNISSAIGETCFC